MADSKTLAGRLAAAWRAGGLKEMPGMYGGYSPQTLAPFWYMPAGYVSTDGVGNGDGNSAVTACLNVLGAAFAEAPVAAYEPDADTQQLVPNSMHPAALRVAQPNAYMVGELLWGYTLTATHIDGDAYWVKVRSQGGRVVELWPLMPDLVEPRDGTGGLATAEERAAAQAGQGPFIAYYEYRQGTGLQRLERQDIVHLRLAINPDNPRKGRAPLRTVLREVLGDEEAGQFAAALLRNMGIPGVVLSPNDPNDLGPSSDEAEAIADAWQSRFGGQNRGRPLVMTGGQMKVDVVSFSPQQMDLKALRRVPEERISAVLGVPAILAGLGAGLDRATYSNAGELREFFTEQKLAPLWRLFGAQLTAQLLPDFDDRPGVALGFDTRDVRALQDDQDKLFARWLDAVRTGAATVADFRRAVGLDWAEADEVYLRSSTLFEVPAGQVPGERIPEPDELEALLARS